MGKRKLESYDLIKDKNSRNVTYCKRKRGLIKKAMELSTLCAQHIYLIIFDKEKQRLIEYRSHKDFDRKVVGVLAGNNFSQYIRQERYDNEHYSYFSSNLNDPKDLKDTLEFRPNLL